MWSDNETDRDFLNFRLVADTAAEMIVQAKGTPLSLGVAGNWGVGKSSMIRLIQDSLKKRTGAKFLFVDFNAWLYQGYDDARAALMDVIARKLVEHGEKTKTNTDKAKDLLKRVDWFRAAKLTASGVAIVYGLPPVAGLEDVKGVIKDKPAPKSPPKEIHELREHFEDTLNTMGITLIVFIDDLDRCMPATAISTLEAFRLFLFMNHTAFIIAADDKMIRSSVRAHFHYKDTPVDEELVTNYFDKLIQVPLRVPPLGTQEVRAYMMSLFIEDSALSQTVKDELRNKISKQLAEAWQGKRVDRAFVAPLITDCPKELLNRLDTADRLGPLMTSSKQIAGNPRLIKRFLNTLIIRMSIARLQNVTVDEAVLAKMLLFERCGGDAAYSGLVAEINNDGEGKARSLKPLEDLAAAGKPIEKLPVGWDADFAMKWLGMPPYLGDQDLRPVMHVSREHLPIISAADQLSSEGAAILTGLLQMKQPNTMFKAAIEKLAQRERALIMDHLLAKAREVVEWGSPPILHACLAVSSADADAATRLAALLAALPPKQLMPAIVPVIGNEPWAAGVLKVWQDASDTPSRVKAAITSLQKPSAT